MVRAGKHVIGLAAVAALGVGMSATVGGTAAQAAPGIGRAPLVWSPDPSTTDNELAAVSADSATDAWAVGQYVSSSGVVKPLFLHWDGMAWSQVSSPVPAGFARLTAVSADSPADAWTVGSTGKYSGQKNVIMHWNGKQWSQVPSPSPGPAGNQLNGVSAVSRTDAWAVGYDASTDSRRVVINHALILHWNGTAWSRVNNLPSLGASPTLRGVSAVSGTDAWAVGNYTNKYDKRQVVTVHWNGMSWSEVRSPSASPTGQAWLNGVSTTAGGGAFAAGSIAPDLQGVQKTLALNWIGSSWSSPATSSTPNSDSYLAAVGADSATNAWAVGYREGLSQYNPYTTVIQHFNGSSWSQVPSPNPGNRHTRSGTSQLFGVSAVSSTDAWAVGDYINTTTGATDTLIAHWNGNTWSQV